MFKGFDTNQKSVKWLHKAAQIDLTKGAYAAYS